MDGVLVATEDVAVELGHTAAEDNETTDEETTEALLLGGGLGGRNRLPLGDGSKAYVLRRC